MAVRFNPIYPQGLFRGGIAINRLSSRFPSSFKRGCVKTKLNQRGTFNLKLEHPKKQEKEPYHYSKQSSIRLF